MVIPLSSPILTYMKLKNKYILFSDMLDIERTLFINELSIKRIVQPKKVKNTTKVTMTEAELELFNKIMRMIK